MSPRRSRAGRTACGYEDGGCVAYADDVGGGCVDDDRGGCGHADGDHVDHGRAGYAHGP